MKRLECNTATRGPSSLWSAVCVAGLALFGGLGVAGCEGTPAPAGASDECPPLEVTSGSSEAERIWARKPGTRACCEYGSRLAVPSTFLSYDSEEACLTDCSCERIDNGTAFVSLECGCGDGSCPALAEVLNDLCEYPGYDYTLERGCGMVSVRRFGSYGGTQWVFDEQSGAVIGFYGFSGDIQNECGTYNTVGGEPFYCPSATRCDPCANDEDHGSQSRNLPDCE